MMEDKENFNEYMISFKNRSLKEKQNIIIEQMKRLAGFVDGVCEEIGVSSEMIINRELLDLNKDNYSEDDFAEAIIVLVNSIQNSVCDITNKLVDIVDNM